jgi:hypothetical protein
VRPPDSKPPICIFGSLLFALFGIFGCPNFGGIENEAKLGHKQSSIQTSSAAEAHRSKSALKTTDLCKAHENWGKTENSLDF